MSDTALLGVLSPRMTKGKCAFWGFVPKDDKGEVTLFFFFGGGGGGGGVVPKDDKG